MPTVARLCSLIFGQWPDRQVPSDRTPVEPAGHVGDHLVVIGPTAVARGPPPLTNFVGPIAVAPDRELLRVQRTGLDCAILSTMDHSVTQLERAFQLAQSGRCGSVEDIRNQLKSEGYSTAQISGKTLARQLQALIQTARKPRGG